MMLITPSLIFQWQNLLKKDLVGSPMNQPDNIFLFNHLAKRWTWYCDCNLTGKMGVTNLIQTFTHKGLRLVVFAWGNSVSLVIFCFCFCFCCCFLLLSLLQPSHPNSTGNCTTVDGKPIDKIHSNGTHCTSGLELTETQFNLLYAIYAWT